LIGHSAAQDGDDLGIISHPGSEIDDGNKGEQGAEQVGEVWNEIQVILKNNVFGGDVLRNELVQVLGNVKNSGDADDQDN
jgi:hypothetical protein